MTFSGFSRVATLRLASTAALLAAFTGCGESGPPLYPVQGKVYIDGKPATEGGVTFRDAQNQMVQLVGAIQPDGAYTMLYNREEGVPEGEYVVTVLVTQTAKTADGKYTGLPKTISHQKYADPSTTPLKVEVKEGNAADAYDLKVTG
jgi:hypothetical protein